MILTATASLRGPPRKVVPGQQRRKLVPGPGRIPRMAGPQGAASAAVFRLPRPQAVIGVVLRAGVRSATSKSWPLCTGSGSPDRLLSWPLVLRPRCSRWRVAGWLAPVGLEFGAEPVAVGVIDLAEYVQRLRPCPVGGGGVT